MFLLWRREEAGDICRVPLTHLPNDIGTTFIFVLRLHNVRDLCDIT